MKQIAILGSTGSIGRSALKVIENFPRQFSVRALSANSNIDALYRQIKIFRPEFACVKDETAALKLKKRLNSNLVKLLTGEEGLKKIAQDKALDQVLLAISGSAALAPLLKAIDCGTPVALANKEALVMAGSIIMERAEKKGVRITPIDSEQSAILQCLDGRDKTKLKNIYLTASGGPLRNIARNRLRNIPVGQVLKHPRWKMGKKITVDSATLMNKGLEVLEAMFLFGVGIDKIKVVIHPQAIIHSMVEFIDGVILAQLSVADMRIPIQYALSYPGRLPASAGVASLDFYRLKELTFQKADMRKFPCLGLAFEAARQLGTLPAVLNAANEVCVEAFLAQKLRFMSIPEVIAKVMRRHANKRNPGLSDILEADSWARNEAYTQI